MSSEQLNLSDAATKPLGEWQQILTGHFTNLSSSRKDKNLPVFALEHGLRDAQLKIISARLIDDSRIHGINKAYWLLWAIYSTELGYEYVGDEYWQSFVEKLRHWDSNQKENIRWAFKEFQRRFNGVIPSGTWARHFSIIAWPITHSILPQDLQYHFARLLFLARYQLRSTSLKNSISVGKLLTKYAYEFNSSRFLNFLQQEELVGRIALAVLDNNPETSTQDLIYPVTLQRVIHDLEQKRNAKDLVQLVRRDLKPKILGATSNANAHERDNSSGHAHIAIGKKPEPLKPKIRLQVIENKRWIASIEIPKFSNFIDSTDIDFFKKTRVTITGVNTNWLPAEALLYAPLKRKLSSWPNEKPLLKFEKNNPILEDISNNFFISNQPWLFNVNSDGVGTEVQGKILRPGGNYVLLYSNDESIPGELTDICDIDCANVYARYINMPTVINDTDFNKYRSWGLEVSRSLKIWPAGVSARYWDGAGISEWLTSESPCFGIIHDYPIDEYTITLGSSSATVIGKPPGEPTFIKIDPLPTGRHTLIIKPKSNLDALKSIEGFILLDVREPESWTPGTTLHTGLSFQIDPNNDDLDAFLSNKTQIKVFGPKNRSINIQLNFFVGKDIARTFTSRPISFPFNTNELKTLCEDATKDENLINAQKLRVRVSCDDLGQKDIFFTRSLNPLRWFYKVEGNSTFIRLVDETDSQEPLKLFFCDLTDPETEKDVSSQDFFQIQEIKNTKGIFFARRGEYQCALIVSYADLSQGFSGLSISPRIQYQTSLNILEYISSIHNWYKARCTRYISQLHQEKIVEAFTTKLFSHLCGSQWANEERNFVSGSNENSAIEKFSQSIGNKSIENVLRYRLITLNGQNINLPEQIAWLYGAIKRCNVSQSDDLIEFAIQLSSHILSYADTTDNAFAGKIDQILQNKALLRACRFFVLGTSKNIDFHNNYRLLTPAGWQ